ncbi:MAG: hypothetical protein JSS87_13995 [Acidobacteria bacterium]|nr:hypothetical protein [Acidobacteriota bacterium]
MRKLLAITLLAVFGLPFVSPLFALSAKSESQLPACCRRNGKHHCTMGAAAGGDHAPAFVAHEKCPYAQMAFTAPLSNTSVLPASSGISVALQQGRHVVAQAASGVHDATGFAHPKRGPPPFFSL